MTYTITDLAAEFAITPRALRFYEEKGLLQPAREGQARLYSKKDRARLQLILRGRDVGLTLYEIRRILALYNEGGDCAEQYKLALALFQKRIAAVTALRDKADEQLRTLETACRDFESKLVEASAPRVATPRTKASRAA
jgi:DNA-binding transcriptional MerR regulator